MKTCVFRNWLRISTKLIVHHNLPDLMYRAFEVLPTMVMTPYAAFQKELHGMTEVYLDEMVGRINANMILPRIRREFLW